MSNQPTQLEFLEHVKNHELAVLFESPDGDYRHIRLRQPSSGNMYFDLITWPGHLCYTGDMGTYVFTRLRDMFEFFRDKGEGELKINPSYWQEKVLSDSKYGKGCEEWSDEKFKKVITDRWESYFDGEKPEPPDPEDSDEEDLEAYHQELKEWEQEKQWCFDEIEEEIFSCDDLEHQGFRMANGFNSRGLTFDDLWGNNFLEYTYRFIWCCYALVWGIRQWDNRPPKLGKAYKYVSRCGTELFVPASLWRFDPFKLFGLVPELVEVIAGMPLMTKEQMDHIYKVNACRPGMVNFLSTGQEDLKLETFMVGGLGAGAEGTMTKAEVREFLASALDLTPDATKP